MEKIFRRFFAFACICFVFLFSDTLMAQPSSILSYRVQVTDHLVPGDTAEVSIILQLAKGWYIYAPSDINAREGMQPTRITFEGVPTGLKKIGSLQMPKAIPEKGFMVYTGENLPFVQSFLVTKDVISGEHAFKAKLTYQACNASTCYPPFYEHIAIAVKVD